MFIFTFLHHKLNINFSILVAKCVIKKNFIFKRHSSHNLVSRCWQIWQSTTDADILRTDSRVEIASHQRLQRLDGDCSSCLCRLQQTVRALGLHHATYCRFIERGRFVSIVYTLLHDFI